MLGVLKAVFIIIFLLSVIMGLGSLLDYFEKMGVEKENQRYFNGKLERCKENVFKYSKKFNSSLSHLESIKNVFHELTESNKLEYLKPFEAYLIPTEHYHFSVYFHILTTENLEYRIVIFDETIDGDNCTDKVKRLIPYSMSLDDFDGFVEKCRRANYEAKVETYRRKQVNDVLKKVNE